MSIRAYALMGMVVVWALAGCSGSQVKEEGAGAPVETVGGATGAASAEESGGQTQGIGSGSGFQGSPLDDPNSPLSERVVYFDFDRSEIHPEYSTMLEAHADYLASHPGTIVRLEGHADERGSPEYNIALGERRALAVKRALVLRGAPDRQIRYLSWGEERPAVEGHNEAAWAKNRRVEFIYEH